MFKFHQITRYLWPWLCPLMAIQIMQCVTYFRFCGWRHVFIHICQSLFSGQNVRWPRHMLPTGESRWVCQWDRRTQTVTLLFSRHDQHNDGANVSLSKTVQVLSSLPGGNIGRSLTAPCFVARNMNTGLTDTGIIVTISLSV